MIAAAAIDVGWLIGQDDADMVENLRVMQAIEAMRLADVPVLLDHEGKILAEYNAYLLAGTFGKKVLSHVMKTGMLHFESGVPSNACLSCLDDDGFHHKDRVYVAVAQRFGGIYVTHEEKHQEPGRVEKVGTHCGVDICDTTSFFAAVGV